MPARTRSLRFLTQFHVLEDRITPATLYLSKSFRIDVDVAPTGLSDGDTVTFTAAAAEVGDLTYGTNAFGSLAAAITKATTGDTVMFGRELNFAESAIVIDKPLTFAAPEIPLSQTGALAIISLQTDTPVWFRVVAGASLNVGDIEFLGLTKTVGEVLRYEAGSGGGTLNKTSFDDVSGTCVVIHSSGVTVSNALFSSVHSGIQFDGNGALTLADSKYQGLSLGTGEVAVQVETTSGANVVISGNRINYVNDTAVKVNAVTGASVNVIGNELTHNGTALAVTGDTGVTVVAEYNTIESNKTNGITTTGPSVDATNVWWGSVAGPVAPNNTNSGGGITTSPLLDGGPPPVKFGVTPGAYLAALPSSGPGGGSGVMATSLTESFIDGRTSPLVFGAGPGAPPRVTYRLPDDTTDRAGFLAYDAGFTGGVRVAVYRASKIRMTIATAAGPGGGPHVKLFNLDGTERASFFAYDPSFTGGVYIALADVNRDAVPDIITGAGEGGGPHVKVFDGVTLKEIANFFAFDPSFRGGVRVAAITPSGRNPVHSPVIVVGAGPGGGPHIRGVTPDGRELFSMMAFEPSFTGGVYVATGDVNIDNIPDLVVGAGEGGAPRVRVFALPVVVPPNTVENGINPDTVFTVNPTIRQDFFAFDPAERVGATVAVGESGLLSETGVVIGPDGKDVPETRGKPGEIVVGRGQLGGPRVRVISQVTGAPILDRFVFDPAFLGGVAVGGLGIPDNTFPPVPISNP